MIIKTYTRWLYLNLLIKNAELINKYVIKKGFKNW